MAIDNKPLTDDEMAVLKAAGYQPAGGGNVAGDGVIILRFRKAGRFFTDTRGGWRATVADTRRLIAAAPELLAACEMAINIDWHGFGAPHVYEQLRAAIAKAREG